MDTFEKKIIQKINELDQNKVICEDGKWIYLLRKKRLVINKMFLNCRGIESYFSIDKAVASPEHKGE